MCQLRLSTQHPRGEFFFLNLLPYKNMSEVKETKYQYFSKWRQAWCNFSLPPSTPEGWETEIAKMKAYEYEIRENPNL